MSAEGRARHCPPELLRSGAAFVWDPLFSRGVAARPKLPPSPPTHRRYWARDPSAPCVATGEVYVDGSARGIFWRARRAAWASVGLGEDGRVAWTLSGSCNEPFASSFRAEQRALLETLRIAAPPLRVHCDNQMVVDGVAKGRKWCLNPRREGASLWRDIWRALDDVGGGVEVVKVKAHTSWRDVLEGKVSLRGQRGNAMADATAKAALEVVHRAAPTAAFDGQLARAMAWHKWVLAYATTWGDRIDTETASAEEARGPATEDAAAYSYRPRTTMSHELWTDRYRVTCRRCGRNAPRDAAHKPLLQEACRGSAAGRAAALHSGNKNHVWHSFALAKKTLVEKGGVLTARSTIPDELIDHSRIGELQADVSGFSIDVAPPPAPAPPPPPPHMRTGDEHELSSERHLRHSHTLTTHSGLPGVIPPPPPPLAAGRRRPRSTGSAASSAVPPEQGPQEGDQPATRRRTEATPRIAIHAPLRPHPDGGHSPPPPAARRRTTPQGPRVEHNVVITGPIAWCTRCARYAHQRTGRGLASHCDPLAGGATSRRLALLARGRHPITGASLT